MLTGKADVDEGQGQHHLQQQQKQRAMLDPFYSISNQDESSRSHVSHPSTALSHTIPTSTTQNKIAAMKRWTAGLAAGLTGGYPSSLFNDTEHDDMGNAPLLPISNPYPMRQHPNLYNQTQSMSKTKPSSSSNASQSSPHYQKSTSSTLYHQPEYESVVISMSDVDIRSANHSLPSPFSSSAGVSPQSSSSSSRRSTVHLGRSHLPIPVSNHSPGQVYPTSSPSNASMASHSRRQSMSSIVGSSTRSNSSTTYLHDHAVSNEASYRGSSGGSTKVDSFDYRTTNKAISKAESYKTLKPQINYDEKSFAQTKRVTPVHSASSSSRRETRKSTTKSPLSPEECLHYYRKHLTAYEQKEILEHRKIYYLGSTSIDKIGSPRRKTGADGSHEGNLSISRDPKELAEEKGVYNWGYDDSRGDYYLIAHDHINYRYEIISILGKGSFGQVAKCYDHKMGEYVALKIIRNKKRFEKQGQVEVKVLDKIRQEDQGNDHNLIHMQENFRFRGHLCITFELLGINLYEWLKAGGFRGVNGEVVKRFTIQMLKCLWLMRENKIVHCDLKPENVLLRDTANVKPAFNDLHGDGSSPRPRPEDFTSSAYDIKVIDFGSSCYESEKIYTYVQSRFYRSPEVILGISYNVAIDMWSLGCIIAELYTGYPLFPGEDEQEQLACIMEVKGVPDKSYIAKGSRKDLYFDANGIPKLVPNSKGKKRRPGAKPLAACLRTSDKSFVDFVEKCLEWDPSRRMTPAEALNHDWVASALRSAIQAQVSTTPRYPASAHPKQTDYYFQHKMDSESKFASSHLHHQKSLSTLPKYKNERHGSLPSLSNIAQQPGGMVTSGQSMPHTTSKAVRTSLSDKSVIRTSSHSASSSGRGKVLPPIAVYGYSSYASK